MLGLYDPAAVPNGSCCLCGTVQASSVRFTEISHFTATAPNLIVGSGGGEKGKEGGENECRTHRPPVPQPARLLLRSRKSQNAVQRCLAARNCLAVPSGSRLGGLFLFLFANIQTQRTCNFPPFSWKIRQHHHSLSDIKRRKKTPQ